jgi:hypothetical protein
VMSIVFSSDEPTNSFALVALPSATTCGLETAASDNGNRKHAAKKQKERILRVLLARLIPG